MADRYRDWNEGAEVSDDEDLVEEYANTTGSYLFLLEATPSMLETFAPASSPNPSPELTAQPLSTLPPSLTLPGEPPQSKMEVALRAVYSMMKRRVISSPRDCVGVVVFNTRDKGQDGTSGSKGGVGSWKNCWVVRMLDKVTAQGILSMKASLEEVQNDPEALARKFAPNNEGTNNIADALGVCSTMFRAKAPKSSAKTIYLITDNDDPLGGNEQLITVARNKRRDLYDMDYNLVPFFVSPSPQSPFDLTKFYGDLVTLPSLDDDSFFNVDDDALPPDYPIVYPSLTSSLNSLIDQIRTKEAQKRSAFSVPFVLGEGFVIGVNGYNLIGEEKIKGQVKVDLSTERGEEVISKTVYKDSTNGAELDPKKDIKKYFQVGKSNETTGVQATKVFFDESDVRKLKTMGRSPALKLLGFKPREHFLKFEETIKHSYFIYPNEDTWAGSTRTFTSLLKTMLEKEKVGFASFLARVSARPQIVIMIPQAEELDSQGLQLRPPGIHMCQLPFADDIRSIGDVSTQSILKEEDESAGSDTNPAVAVMKDIIKNYTNKRGYLPDSFPNPALNFWNETLAAFALEEEDLPEPVDKTIPKYQLINRDLGKHIANLRSLIKQDEVDTSALVTSKKKRPLTAAEQSALNGPPASEDDIKEWAKEYWSLGDKMKVADLKSGCKLLGVGATGVKKVLQERIDEKLREMGIGRKGKGKKKVVKEEEDSEVEEEEDDEPVRKKAKKGRKKVVDSDEEEDD